VVSSFVAFPPYPWMLAYHTIADSVVSIFGFRSSSKLFLADLRFLRIGRSCSSLSGTSSFRESRRLFSTSRPSSSFLHLSTLPCPWDSGTRAVALPSQLSPGTRLWFGGGLTLSFPPQLLLGNTDTGFISSSKAGFVFISKQRYSTEILAGLRTCCMLAKCLLSTAFCDLGLNLV
jgi:hypothetical protein